MSKVTQAMNYEITFDKATYKLLDNISYSIWKVKTKATTMAYDWQQFSFSYNERLNTFPKDKELLGISLLADITRETKQLAPTVGSMIVDTASQSAVKKLVEMKMDIVKGNKSIPTYRRDGSFPIRTQSINKLEKLTPSKYKVKLSLLSREGAKVYGMKGQQEVTLKTGNGANLILDRILDNTYKMCDSLVFKKKNKYYLSIVYQFDKEVVETLDKYKVMGIDMGIVYPVYMAFNDSLNRYNIEGGELDRFRKTVQARRNSMLKQGKYCGEGRRGHGRKTLLKPIEKLQGKVENFKNSTNHKYSKYVVDMAVKHNCGVIQMEDLTGISDGEKKGTFLGNWTYYDLQQKIRYKAESKGIEIIMVKPNYTSQRCSKCGCINKKNRDAKVDQAKFKCVTCGFETNADFNAARNIATPYIETIIKEQLEFQKKVVS